MTTPEPTNDVSIKKSATQKSSGTPAWVGLFLALMSVCVTIFILELAVRLLPPPYEEGTGNVPLFNDQANDILVCDKNLGWTGRPNFQSVVEQAGFRVNLAFNSSGFHDTEHSLEKAPNTFRILMLGDSFVHAIQVDETATAHQVLEDYLNQRKMANPIAFEVINGGVSGWGTDQQLLAYREQGRRFQPDLVLLMFFIGNDFENNVPGNVLTIQGFDCYAPYFVLCQGQLDPDPLKYAPGLGHPQDNCSSLRRAFINTMGTLYQDSRLYQQLDPLIISYRPPQMFGQAYPSPFWALYTPTEEVELELVWQVTQGLITQLQQEVEADGAQFAVVFFPWNILIQLSLFSPTEQQALLKENFAFTEVDIDRPNRRLAGFLSEQNIPFIDLTGPMIERQASQEISLHFVGDSHWTVEGNRFVADTLAQWLAQNNLLPE